MSVRCYASLFDKRPRRRQTCIMQLAVRKLPLSNSPSFVLMDAEDAARLPVKKLRLNTLGYPYMELRRTTIDRHGLKICWRAQLCVHTWLIPDHSSLVVDHINQNKLDARRKNLRLVSRGRNQQNSGPRQNAVYKGVHQDARFPGSYNVEVGANSEHFRCRVNSAEVGARLYDREALRVYGSPCYLNFPTEDNSNYQPPKESVLKRKEPASGCPGVYFNHLTGLWYVQVKRKTIGSGLTKSEAIKLRRAA